MDYESMRSLIGVILLWAMGISAVLYLLWKNRDRIREICYDENGKFDPLKGLERHFLGAGDPQEPAPENTDADEDFMDLIRRQKGAQMAEFDPERERIREHIIFRGRVQGVGFRYQAMYASRTFGRASRSTSTPLSAANRQAIPMIGSKRSAFFFTRKASASRPSP